MGQLPPRGYLEDWQVGFSVLQHWRNQQVHELCPHEYKQKHYYIQSRTPKSPSVKEGPWSRRAKWSRRSKSCLRRRLCLFKWCYLSPFWAKSSAWNQILSRGGQGGCRVRYNPYYAICNKRSLFAQQICILQSLHFIFTLSHGSCHSSTSSNYFQSKSCDGSLDGEVLLPRVYCSLQICRGYCRRPLMFHLHSPSSRASTSESFKYEAVQAHSLWLIYFAIYRQNIIAEKGNARQTDTVNLSHRNYSTLSRWSFRHNGMELKQ